MIKIGDYITIKGNDSVFEVYDVGNKSVAVKVIFPKSVSGIFAVSIIGVNITVLGHPSTNKMLLLLYENPRTKQELHLKKGREWRNIIKK